MSDTLSEINKALVLEAFDAAFNRREPDALERYWSPDYIQHSAHIGPGRAGLQAVIAILRRSPPIQIFLRLGYRINGLACGFGLGGSSPRLGFRFRRRRVRLAVPRIIRFRRRFGRLARWGGIRFLLAGGRVLRWTT